MSQVCPISAERVNEKVVRLNAFFAVLGVLIFLFTPFKWILYVLLFDFAMRAFKQSKFSPLAIVSKFLLNLIKVEPVMTDAKPKLFAASVGLLFCILLTLFQYLGLNLAVYVTSGIFMFAAGLEFSIGYCVGCKVYHLIQILKS